jgi:cell shape-determining protein MreD
MNWVHTILILVIVFLAVFFQCTFNSFRALLGAQIDLLPGLVVYAGLTCGPVTLALLCLMGGLWFDSLSANPLGVSILPLCCIGFVLQYYRGLILRDQFYAQAVLGLSASAFAPVVTLLLIFNAGGQPLLGWFSLWQWLVMACVGGALTPLWFYIIDKFMQALSYQQAEVSAFRPDRQIKRGRI